MLRVNILFLLLFALERHFTIAASPRAINLKYAAVQPPKPTQPPAKNSTRGTDEELRRRQVTSIGSKTCGYYDGDPTKFRTADGGYGCRLDINNGLWGFCPTTVISPKDCGLAGACEDRHACANGCGKTGIEGLTTFTCSSTNQYCSTVILKGDYEGGFSYIACGAQAVVETLFQSPTVAAVPSVTITPDSSTASETETTSISTDAKSSQASTSSTSTGATATGALQSSTESTAAASETATPAGQDNSDGDSSSTPNTTGIIIGGVIGGIAIVCVTVVTAVYLLRRNRGSKENNEGRSSRFFSWRKSSQKPPTYDQSEATQVDQNLQYTADNNKTYAGWGPAEVYGSEAWRNPTAPVEMPSAPAPPVELPSRRY
ncbi:hypothetical protein CGCA056_v012879 [Colletotrichum aenigma]|uniref:uncharacterized protein n=1 Tax=Colletotrichum aenigma TaxID=1215731 RepID=UPI0018724885|nr:uncharacterized protein CGCA056_v012879 [Colletotrichum aenigma]KAF5507049.1 hypothetical protein CGCA056_v012879 [Colletotrichum aenigma]